MGRAFHSLKEFETPPSAQRVIQDLFRRKPLSTALNDIDTQQFRRCLTAVDVTALGLGAIIGAGIFVITGVAAAKVAGPAIIISYIIAGMACCFSALCYAEFAARVPSSGSAYSYSYISVGELMAWIIGWDLTLEYVISSAAIARGWSGYLRSILEAAGLSPPAGLDHIVISQGWGEGVIALDPLAALSVVVLSIILAVGVKESIRLTAVMVIVKVVIIFFVMITGSLYTDTDNWRDFTPYGFSGIASGAAMIFFAYLGFDMVVNVAEETKNPQRDIPIGILASLIISTLLYIGVATVITLMVYYADIDIDAPLAAAFADHNLVWAQVIIAVGAFVGLTTAEISNLCLVSQPRLYYSLSKDGLLPPWFSQVHPRFRTPINATIATCVVAGTVTFFLPIDILSDMASIGTLFAFTLVSACTLTTRYTYPEAVELPASPTTTQLGAKLNKSVDEQEGEDFNVIGQGVDTGIAPVTLKGKWANFKAKHLVTMSPSRLVIVIIILAGLTAIFVVFSVPLALSILSGIATLIVSCLFFFLESKNIPVNFRCPGMPVVPILAIYFNVYLMANLSIETWVRLIVWLALGLVIYFGYGRKHSKLRLAAMYEKEKDDDFSSKEGGAEEDVYNNTDYDITQDGVSYDAQDGGVLSDSAIVTE